METELFENALQTGGIWKRGLCVLVWTENILKTEPLVNDDMTIVMWFPLPSFPKTQPKTQIQNGRWLLPFQISRSVYGKHLMGFQNENTVFKFLRRNVDGA